MKVIGIILAIYLIVGVLFALLMLLLDIIDRSKRTPVVAKVFGFILHAVLWLPILLVALLIGRKDK